MSALPPKADIAGRQLNVRFVPKADSCAAAKNLSGLRFLCIRPHEPSALQALGGLDCVEIIEFRNRAVLLGAVARSSGLFSGVDLARSRERAVTIPVLERCSLSWNSDWRCGTFTFQ
jgi:hypothetical protein